MGEVSYHHPHFDFVFSCVFLLHTTCYVCTLCMYACMYVSCSPLSWSTWLLPRIMWVHLTEEQMQKMMDKDWHTNSFHSFTQSMRRVTSGAGAGMVMRTVKEHGDAGGETKSASDADGVDAVNVRQELSVNPLYYTLALHTLIFHRILYTYVHPLYTCIYTTIHNSKHPLKTRHTP